MKTLISMILILGILGAAAAVIKLILAAAGMALGMILLVAILSHVTK